MSARRRPFPSRPPTRPDSSGTGEQGEPAASPATSRLPGAPRRRLDTPTGLAVLAVALAGVALVVGLMNLLGSGRSSCQAASWDAVPAGARLPAGWTVGTTDYYLDSQTTTLVGPATDETTGGGALVYASVSCYAGSAGDALHRSRTSAEAAGATIDALPELGDEAYAMSDPSTGSSAYHIRRGALLAYLAVSGTVAPVELDQVAAAVDAAMVTAQGGAAAEAPTTAVTRPSPTAAAGETPGTSAEPSSGPGESAEPTAGPVAAGLEAILPAEVDGVTLAKDSTTADVILTDGAASRALVAALRSLGKSASDLLMAQAYDDTGTLEASVLGFQLPGVDGATLRTIILETWLLADAPGVTAAEVTLSGKTLTRVSYGDEGSISYVYVHDDAVLVIETTNEEQATRIAASLP